MTITGEFGAAVKAKRIEHKLTQVELARKAGINREQLSAIEGGTRNDSIKNDTAEKIARALGCTISVLLK